MTTVAALAQPHAARQAAIARSTAEHADRLWAQVDPRAVASSWRMLLQRAVTVVSGGQTLAASSANPYVAAVAASYGPSAGVAGQVNPAMFAGIASDGRPLATLLYQPAITALTQIQQGQTPRQALGSGRFTLDMITRTQVSDAGRAADATAIAAHRQLTGYVRLVEGGACARCLILAGRRYHWNTGFQRHPRCNCRHVPVAEDVPGDVATNPKVHFDALDEAAQDKLLGRADAEAVRHGADIARVVNARRGMQVAGGRLYTHEAAGRRPRLMPEQIMRDAKDRDDAIRLLRLHGYIRM